MDLIHQLHEQVIQCLLNELKEDHLKPVMLTHAINFLKNNDITAVSHKGNSLDELNRQLSDNILPFSAVADD